MTWAHGKIMEGKPVVVVGQGPSLTEDGMDEIAESGIPVIAIKDSSRYIVNPWMIYACDLKWWIKRWADERYEYLREYSGHKMTMNWQKRKHEVRNLKTINFDGIFGLSFRDGNVRHGRNSGYQMINHAINLGANPVILYGFDMSYSEDGRSHGVPEHVAVGKGTFREFVNYFNTMEHDLEVWGGQIWNTCMTSALNDKLFPKRPLKSVLAEYSNARS